MFSSFTVCWKIFQFLDIQTHSRLEEQDGFSNHVSKCIQLVYQEPTLTIFASQSFHYCDTLHELETLAFLFTSFDIDFRIFQSWNLIVYNYHIRPYASMVHMPFEKFVIGIHPLEENFLKSLYIQVRADLYFDYHDQLQSRCQGVGFYQHNNALDHRRGPVEFWVYAIRQIQS